MRTKLILLLFLLTSCADSEVSKALRNEKTRTTDEFLIEKRGPLSMPPKMGELPKPNSGSNNKKDNENILGYNGGVVRGISIESCDTIHINKIGDGTNIISKLVSLYINELLLHSWRSTASHSITQNKYLQHFYIMIT